MTTALGYRVDSARIMDTIERLARISEPGEGVTRLAYTAQEDSAHAFIREYMETIGLRTRVDAVGNLHGTLTRGYGRKLIVGSHLDSVPNGGKYDGTLGVAVGIEAARTLKDAGLRHSLEIAVFRAEESSRFNLSCIGSKLVTGHLSAEELREGRDKKGVSAYDAMTSLGLKPDSAKPWNKSSIDIYIEPHIEQADTLLDAGIPVGVVTGIRAPIRYMVTVTGKWGHSGATQMLGRRDAAAAAFEMGSEVERLANEYEENGCQTVATVPSLIVEGWAINKVTGMAVLPIDIRGDDAIDCSDLADTILKEFKRIALKRGVSIETKITEKGTPAKLREQDYRIIEEAATSLGIRSLRMPSGAGHDAQYISLYGIPTAIIFVRNSGGSHNPAESVMEEDVEDATRVLVETIVRTDAR